MEFAPWCIIWPDIFLYFLISFTMAFFNLGVVLILLLEDKLGAIKDFVTDKLLQLGQFTNFFLFCFAKSEELSNHPSNSISQVEQIKLKTIT